MKPVEWTVARYPDGTWDSGGCPDSPDYAHCEVFQVIASGRDEAERLGKAQYRKQLRKKAKPCVN